MTLIGGPRRWWSMAKDAVTADCPCRSTSAKRSLRGCNAIVRRACVQAGVAPVGPHRLRHTMATEMVNIGVPLAEISQVLRHRSLTSTAIYARVDLEGLRRIARPWPGRSDS